MRAKKGPFTPLNSEGRGLNSQVQEMVDELSALGLRHVGYGVPVSLFLSFLKKRIELSAPFDTEKSI